MTKPIWYKEMPAIADFNALGHGNMGAWLGIEFTDIGPDYLVARMPVDHRTRQPYGLLHGGASVVLAETIGSVASHFCVDTSLFYCVGVEVNASHLSSARQGYVTGICKPLRLGRTMHVWQIDIRDERDAVICSSRLSVAIMLKK